MNHIIKEKSQAVSAGIEIRGCALSSGLRLCLGILALSGAISALGTELISPPPPFVESKTQKMIAGNAEITFTNGEFLAGQHTMNFPASPAPFLSWKGQKQLDFYFRVVSGTKWIPAFSKFKTEIIPESKTIIGRSSFLVDMADKDGPKGMYVQKARLADDKHIEMEFSYKCPKGSVGKFKQFVPTLLMPRTMCAGKTVKVDGKLLTIPDETEWFSSLKGKSVAGVGGGAKVRKLEFSPDYPEGFTLEFPKPAIISIRRNKNSLFIYIGSRSFKSAEGSLKMVMSLNKGGEVDTKGDCVVGGINFTQCDNLNVPVYKGSVNMLMNPAFNSGFRYFSHLSTVYMDPDPDKALVDCEAPFGNRAVLMSKISSRPGFKSLGIPILAHTPYTLSFYAKPQGTDGSVLRAAVGGTYRPYPKNSKTFNLKPGKWTRCFMPFSLPIREIIFAVSRVRGDSDVLVGGFQLEKDNKATAYCGNPFGMEIKTGSPDGMVCEAKKPIDAKLIIRGPAGAKGKVDVQATDFYRRKFYTKTFSFDLGKNGQEELALPINSITPLGPSVIKAELQPEGGKEYTDYFRLTRMKYVGNKFKNKEIHTTGFICPYPPSFISDSMFDFLRKCGFSKTYLLAWRSFFKSENDVRRDYSRLQKYGMTLQSQPALATLAAEISRKNGSSDWKNATLDGFPMSRSTIKEVSPEFALKVEDAFCELAKSYPFIDTWVGFSEPGASILVRKGKYDDIGKLLVAMNKGVKRGNPNAKFIIGGSCNMGKHGREVTLKMVEACGKVAPGVKFDGLDIHPYRAFPEQPDTDSDLQLLFKGLKKLGYGDNFPVYLNEGFYFYPLNIPVWNSIAPWNSAGYIAPDYPSYDMGWAARLQPAMTLRGWLACYKYANRIKAATPWSRKLLDCRVPHAIMPMSSALADILGNATFKRDIRFAPGARAYVFEDEKKRPVAAVWYFSESVERGKKLPPRMTASFKDAPEFLDMFGNVCKALEKNGKYDLPLSNFPFFIRGKAGDLNELCAGLQNASVGGAGFIPLSLTARPVTKDEVLVDIANLLTKPFKGTVSIKGAKTVKLDLAARGKIKLPYKQKGLIPDDKIENISIPVTITEKGGKPAKNDFRFRAFAANYVKPGKIKIDASGDDWKNIPSISMNDYLQAQHTFQVNKKKVAGIFNASYKVAWNDKAVYMLIKVNDSGFAVDHSNPVPGSWYKQGGVQLFWDSLGDAREKAASNVLGYDDNDYSYELLPAEDGKSAVVYRRLAPDIQLTGGVAGCLKPNVLEPGVKVAFRNNGGKQIYEVEFPARYIQPLQLNSGTSSGLGIMIFDHTGKIVTTNGKGGKGFYQKPYNCPYMLLSGGRK